MRYSIFDLRCDGRVNPLGIDTAQPVFGWKLSGSGENAAQTAYRIQVMKGDVVLWDSGEVESSDSAHILYAGPALQSCTRYAWKLTSRGVDGSAAEGMAWFETALMRVEDWSAKWVEPVQQPAFHEPPRKITDRGLVPLEEVKLQPGQLLRKAFRLRGPVRKARAYVTAHGVYRMHINGARAGDIQLAPGSTSYHKYQEYQTYDITAMLREGENALCMWLADGWYVGKHGMIGRSCPFGDTIAALFQLEIEYTDGSRDHVISDGDCRSIRSEVDYADLFVGQREDARSARPGCDLPGYNDGDWTPVEVKDYSLDHLRAEYGDPVRIVKVRKPANLYRSPKGEWILDAGQVLTGRVRMRVRGAAGTQITLEHSETVDGEGCFFNNIRGFFCHQTDTYILRGDGEEIFDPEFTFHGFQYVRITGYPGEPRIEDFDVLVIASDLRTTGQFSCSDARLNQLQHNIFWSQLGNLLSVPTDCPQREKSGWTGDAQIFAPTACFNMDMLAFYRRWLRNVRLDQQADGQVPVVVPYIEAYHPNGFFFYDTHTSAAWGDAAVLLPWTLYCSYGDVEILRENYDMMKKWVGYVQHTAETEIPENLEGELTPERREWQKYLWNTHKHFGDWLAPSVSVDPETGDINLSRSAFFTMDIVPTCFYAGCTRLMAEIASILGREEDARCYAELNRRIQWAFAAEYMDEHGLIRKRLQGVYVLAIHMGLLEGEALKKNLRELVRMIEENGYRLDTGFVSVPYLLDVLADHGEWDTAEKLLMQEECPSWLYQVKMGATSMWEAWQAILPDGTKTSVSYNHYSLGCVGQWIYRRIGGLDADLPGYKRVLFDPHPLGGITSASCALDTVYGMAKIEWKLANGCMDMDLTVPTNSSGRIVLGGRRAVVDGMAMEGAETAELCAGHHHVQYSFGED